jgi:hypothetical protein
VGWGTGCAAVFLWVSIVSICPWITERLRRQFQGRYTCLCVHAVMLGITRIGVQLEDADLGLKPIGSSWSYLASRIGPWVPIWRSYG